MHGWDWTSMVRLVSSCRSVSMGVKVFEVMSNNGWSKIFWSLFFGCMFGWLCVGVSASFSKLNCFDEM